MIFISNITVTLHKRTFQFISKDLIQQILTKHSNSNTYTMPDTPLAQKQLHSLILVKLFEQNRLN